MKNYYFRSSFALVVCLLVAACQPMLNRQSDTKNVSISPINTLFIEERQVVDKNYKNGETLTAYVGEAIVKRKTSIAKIQSELSAMPAMNVGMASSEFGQLSLSEGINYPVKYDVFINGEKFTALEVASGNGVLAVLFDANGVIYDRVMKDGKLMDGIFTVRPLNAYVKMSRPEKVIEKKPIENFEIIYGGVNNNQINMTYREYSPDDVARTAFFQELTYPTNSKIIRYKTLKINVVNINSEGITFEVVSD